MFSSDFQGVVRHQRDFHFSQHAVSAESSSMLHQGLKPRDLCLLRRSIHELQWVIMQTEQLKQMVILVIEEIVFFIVLVKLFHMSSYHCPPKSQYKIGDNAQNDKYDD